jgi:hypothetical protein
MVLATLKKTVFGMLGFSKTFGILDWTFNGRDRTAPPDHESGELDEMAGTFKRPTISPGARLVSCPGFTLGVA